jgi:hypothetical protein
MTVKVTKPAISIREKLAELDKQTGIKGEELMQADTSADAREVLELDQHLFEEFESTGIDDNATSTAVTIDSSGNLLVGTTTDRENLYGCTATHGQIADDGMALFSTDAKQALDLNRLNSDGGIIIFRKDGISVGSISSASDQLEIKSTTSSHAGLRLGNNDTLFPLSGGSLTDGVTSIGSLSRRFKDLYLSGGVYLGGTGSANHLDDYEEGTWTPVVSEGSFSASGAIYTKIGRFVNVKATINNFTDTTSASAIVISGLPYNIRGTDQFAAFGYSINIQYSESAFWQAQDSNNTLQLRRNVNSSSTANMVYSNITSSTNSMYIDISYMTDS